MEALNVSAVDDIQAELARARAKFGPMHSGHEGLAVVEEEFEEFKAEVFHGSRENARAEAVQLAAMAQRFIEDVSDQPEPEHGPSRPRLVP